MKRHWFARLAEQTVLGVAHRLSAPMIEALEHQLRIARQRFAEERANGEKLRGAVFEAMELRDTALEQLEAMKREHELLTCATCLHKLRDHRGESYGEPEMRPCLAPCACLRFVPLQASRIGAMWSACEAASRIVARIQADGRVENHGHRPDPGARKTGCTECVELNEAIVALREVGLPLHAARAKEIA